MSIVVDSSVALNWVMPDERSERSDRLLDMVAADGAIVPPLFRIEVGNALLLGVRRKRVSADFPGRAIDLIKSLPLRTDPDGQERVWSNCLALAAARDLTLYDAVYLELALRLGMPLATNDTKLAAAATLSGVPAAAG